jgi:hypothetical protein
MKDKYINAIKEVGFQEVKIIKQAQFNIEDMTSDPVGKTAWKNPPKPLKKSH